MGRKKKYKDGELEKEFEKFKFYHKYIAVKATLLSQKDIFDSYLIKDRYTLKGSVKKKTETLCNLLMDMHDRGDDKDLDELYNYCWNVMVEKFDEHINFTENF